eukprot:COSAG06_NODE_2825_length_6217_cov_39.483164_4_plen_224_part_00
MGVFSRFLRVCGENEKWGACAAVAERADPPSCRSPAPPAHVPAARPPPAAAAARESTSSFAFVFAAAPPADARGARSRRLLRPCSPHRTTHHQGTCGRSSREIACKGKDAAAAGGEGVELNQEKALSPSEACLGKRTCTQPSAPRIAPPPHRLSAPRCLAGRSALLSAGPPPLPPLRLSALPPPAAAAPGVPAAARQAAPPSAPLPVARLAQLAFLRSTRAHV